MNLVILTILLPYPLTSGGAQAQYNMIDQLRHHHRISIVFLENPDNKMWAMRELQRRWPEVTFYPYRYWRQLTNPLFLYSKVKRALQLKFCSGNERFVVKRLLEPYGYPMHFDFQRFMNKVLREQQADIVQVEFYPYLSYIHKLPKTVSRVFVHHELRYVRNQRLLSSCTLTDKEKLYQRRMSEKEIDDLNAYDMVVTLTDVDCRELKSKGVHVPILVSPAAVNAEIRTYNGWNGKITFLGGYGHTPNKEGMDWFLEKVAPLVNWKRYPQAEIQIIGGGWPADYGKSVPGVKVNVCGFVENLAEAAAGSIMIVPILSGSGMRMKILEAAAMSLPMINTTVGAEGLDFVSGDSCLIADTPADFATALETMMNCDALRVRLTACARDVFEKTYSASALARVRTRIYDSLLHTHGY